MELLHSSAARPERVQDGAGCPSQLAGSSQLTSDLCLTALHDTKGTDSHRHDLVQQLQLEVYQFLHFGTAM